jgi:diguanylate cyclase (GGDEF)-like protein
MNVPWTASTGLGQAALDRLMPMHAQVTGSGHVTHAGPTLCKLLAVPPVGRRFLELFEMRRPHDPRTMADLLAAPDGRLQLSLRHGPRTSLKGQAVAAVDGGLLVDLSFGISVVEALSHHQLTASDFAPTDLTVEMLYLVEAKSAVMRESQKLNARLKDAKRAAEQQALSDKLTGLSNRRGMDEALARMLARGERFGLMHLDLDYFKDVNDSLGHAAGDHVLTVVAEVLREVTRGEDALARVGGDEFAVLIRETTDLGALSEMGRRLIAALERPIPWQGAICRISGSVGITTTAHYRRPDADRMLSDADEALYASKRGGRGRVTAVQMPPADARAEPESDRRAQG